MQRSSLIRIVFAVSSLGAIGCTDLGVGDPCIPETVPCNADGEKCGYVQSESYIEASSVQCRSRLCLVYKLDNETNGLINADPRNICGSEDEQDGCVRTEKLLDSVYCTCRCGAGGTGNKQELCKCGEGFTCEPILTIGNEGIIGDYCVKTSSINRE
jgi:hypothetical protein